MSSLNDSQKKIAETTEGMIVVDAGPGTGKTHTIVQRCINILKKEDVDSKDAVMLTFTRNAAQEMKDRIIGTLDGMREAGELDPMEYRDVSTKAKDMYIGTFDSFCLNVVLQTPGAISRFFNLEQGLTHGAKVVEGDSVNKAYFGRVLDRFLEENGSKYGDAAALMSTDPDGVYDLLNRLMSRGILPMTGGRWIGGENGKELYGDEKGLVDLMRRGWVNAASYQKEEYVDFPEYSEYDINTKEPSDEMLETIAYDPSRENLVRIVHDIFYEFIRRSVADDRLTFGLTATFAFIVLLTDPSARERASCRYLLVDEFQDTNSNQLMISLMILREPNLCVVGDWKQGIYGFRFVSVDNILRFGDRVRELTEFLGDNGVELPFPSQNPVTLPLLENYRSSQTVIDAAYDSLKFKGTQKDKIDPHIDSKITLITAHREEEIGDKTFVETVECNGKESQFSEVLRTIERYVSGEDGIAVVEDGEERIPRYRDIAILCRQTSKCRRIYRDCLDAGIPAFLQGDVDVMDTREGKLVLAWLKYISNDADPWGYVPILADLGYSKDEIDRTRLLPGDDDRIEIPGWMLEARKDLRRKRRRVTDLVSSIFALYGIDNDYSHTIVSVLTESHRSTLLTISDLVRMIESDIEKGTRYGVDGLPDTDAVTIQTVHKSKGLEYPIVIVPGMDDKSFPNNKSDKGFLYFDRIAGIRCSKAVIEYGDGKKIGRSWRRDAALRCIPKDYSEERRLMFVAVSRAKQYVSLIAGNPSMFFTGFEKSDNTVGRIPGKGTVEFFCEEDDVTVPRPVIGSYPQRRRNIGVHDILHFEDSDPVPTGSDDTGDGKGMKYGTEVHRLAELMVNGVEITEEEMEEFPQTREVASILSKLRDADCQLIAERECTLPVDAVDDSYLATLRGIIDMVVFHPDRSIVIHDWKTDRDPAYADEYKVQLSVYAYAVRDFYREVHGQDRKVTCEINWLTQKRNERFDPVPFDEIQRRVDEYENGLKEARGRIIIGIQSVHTLWNGPV